jgi:hypothetical protein
MKEQKVLILDSGPLISFAMNGLLEEFKELKKIFNGKFIITEDVKHEVIDKPLTIKRFELEALKIKELLELKVLEMPSVLGISDSDIEKKTREIDDISNSMMKNSERNVHLIDSGEASCLALSRILLDKGVKNVIAVDERTTRMLAEKPDNLMKLLGEKLHTKILFDRTNYKIFSGMKIIRSTELIYVAYKKGIIKLKDPMVLDALLYALKFKGCSISDDEIAEIKRMK